MFLRAFANRLLNYPILIESMEKHTEISTKENHMEHEQMEAGTIW